MLEPLRGSIRTVYKRRHKGAQTPKGFQGVYGGPFRCIHPSPSRSSLGTSGRWGRGSTAPCTSGKSGTTKRATAACAPLLRLRSAGGSAQRLAKSGKAQRLPPQSAEVAPRLLEKDAPRRAQASRTWTGWDFLREVWDELSALQQTAASSKLAHDGVCEINTHPTCAPRETTPAPTLMPNLTGMRKLSATGQ